MVGALVNAVFLFALCFTILVDAIERLVQGDKIKDPRLVLIVGGVGLAVNLLGILLFSSHGKNNSNNHICIALGTTLYIVIIITPGIGFSR